VWSVVGRRTARPGTLSLHDALPIYLGDRLAVHNSVGAAGVLGLLGQNLHTTGIDCTVGAPQHAQRLPVHGADVAGAVDPELAEAVLVLIAVTAGHHRAFKDDKYSTVGVRRLEHHGRT